MHQEFSLTNFFNVVERLGLIEEPELQLEQLQLLRSLWLLAWRRLRRLAA
jgi:hypothetical protein